MRATLHNGRRGSNGTYSARHNDRNFDVRAADHIKEEKMAGNIKIHCYSDTIPGLTFEEAEQKFYEEHFSEALEERNARSIKQGHKERVQSMEKYRKSAKSCPEESIIQVGRAGETVDKETLMAIAIELMDWEKKTFPAVHILDIALHVDEEGAPHIHERKVWMAHDSYGRAIVGQAKALAEMGIERPDPTKKEGRHNNAKQTYSRKMRDKYIEIAKEHGIVVEQIPKEKSKTGLTLDEYKARQEQEKALRAEEQAAEALKRLQSAREQAEEAAGRAEQSKKAAEEWKAKEEEARQEHDALVGEVKTAKELMKPIATRKWLGLWETKEVTIPYQEYDTLQKTARAVQDARTEMQEAVKKARKAEGDMEEARRMRAEVDPLHKKAQRDREEAERARKEAEQALETAQEKESRAAATLERLETKLDRAEAERRRGYESGMRDAEENILDKAGELFERYVEEGGELFQRLKDFCRSLKYRDGSTVWSKFEDRERERMDRIWDDEER